MRGMTNVWARNGALVLACWSGAGCEDDIPREADTAGVAADRVADAAVTSWAESGGEGRSGACEAPDPMCIEPMPTQAIACGE